MSSLDVVFSACEGSSKHLNKDLTSSDEVPLRIHREPKIGPKYEFFGFRGLSAGYTLQIFGSLSVNMTSESHFKTDMQTKYRKITSRR